MKQKHTQREKELLRLSELIGESQKRLREETIILEKLMWLLIYNAGEHYSGELKTQPGKSKKKNSKEDVT